MKRLFLLVASIVVFSCSLSTSDFDDPNYQITNSYPANTASASDANYYQSLLDQSARNGLPGITMVVDSPSGFWAGASGIIDIPNKINAKPYTLFKIGSITKSYTAAIFLILEEEGKLSLNDKITKYLSSDITDKIENSTDITIQHLLSHRSGIHNYSGTDINSTTFPITTYNNLFRSWTYDDILHYIYYQPADFEAGTSYKYSNSNYILLGMIAESIEEKSFMQIISDKIFTPLNLQNSYYPSMSTLPTGLARGYQALYGDNKLYDLTETKDYAFPDGGVIANSYNVSLFYKALFNQTLFSIDQLNKMTDEISIIASDNSSINAISHGLGLYKLVANDNTVAYWHNGHVPGYSSEVYHFPATDTTIVIFSNCVNHPASDENWAFTTDIIFEIGR